MTVLRALWRKWQPRPSGHFDGRRGEVIGGWLLDQARAQHRCWVRLEGRGEASLLVRADQYRGDLRKAGHGDGYHGFSLPLAKFGPAEDIRAFDADSGRELHGSPWRREALRPAAWSGRVGTLQVVIDKFAPPDGRVSGYVVDTAAPYKRHRVAMLCDGQTLDQARACLFRVDARNTGGDGFNGFVLRATARRAGSISIIAPELGVVLATSPSRR